jgi:hypothetical protein
MSTSTAGGEASPAAPATAFETFLLGLDGPVGGPLLRGLLGFALTPASIALLAERITLGRLALVVVGVLALVRVVFAAARRLLPFPNRVTAQWAERRGLAKRYDSYQWRKLFGVGVGWAAYLVLIGPTSHGREFATAAGICLAAGAAGLAWWARVCKDERRRLDAFEPTARSGRSNA